MDYVIFSLLSISGFIGVILGAFISRFAVSELSTGKKYFQWLRHACLLFAIALISYQWGGVMYLVFSLLITSLVLRVVTEKVMNKLFVVVLFAILLVSPNFDIIKPVMSLFFIAGVLQGGILANRHRKVITHKKEFYTKIVYDSLLFVIFAAMLILSSLFIT